MTTASKLSLAVVALLAIGTTTVQAQANINATATVVTPLVLTGVRDLGFGNVLPGVNKTIAVADATSGEFSIAGTPSAEVSMTFTLPANLASGANNLPIATWTGYHNTTNNATAGGSAFTPSGASTLANLAAGTGLRFVFVGATVSPAGGQAPGAYTAQVTMNVVYTGN